MNDFVLFIDTETSDIPRRWNAPKEKENKWPYILQVSWLVYTRDGELVKSENHYINTGNIKISRQSQNVHGITLELLNELGRERKDVISLLKSDFLRYRPMVVGHFLEFDHKMLDVGFHRAGIENILSLLPQFCTMKITSGLDKFRPGHMLRLPELHELLFGYQQSQQHNALNDAQATADCFFELLKRGIINDKVIQNQEQERKRQAWRQKVAITVMGTMALLLFITILLLVLINLSKL